jgi:hypothetical protein
VKTSLGISRLEAGRWRVAEDDEEKRQWVGQRGEGDEDDRRAQHGSDVRERRRLYRNPAGNAPKLLGSNGLSGDPAVCGAKRASAGGARPDGLKSEENSFSNKN